MAARLVLAKLETEHFTFEAAGLDKWDALLVLGRGWDRHCEQYPEAQKDYVILNVDSVAFTELETGRCLRDGEEL